MHGVEAVSASERGVSKAPLLECARVQAVGIIIDAWLQRRVSQVIKKSSRPPVIVYLTEIAMKAFSGLV